MSDEPTSQAPQPSEMALLRAEMRAGFQSIDHRFDGVDKRLDGIDIRLDGVDTRLDGIDIRLDGVDTRLDGINTRLAGHDRRFDEGDTRAISLDARITAEAEATRRHFDVVAEGLRESLKVVIDKTTATGEKVDRLIASNAIEHAAFIDAVTDHEVRITRLEKTTESAHS